MGVEVGDAIALATAWLQEELGAWQFLARDAAKSDPVEVLSQFSQLVVELAHAVAELGALGGTPESVLQQLALIGERSDGPDAT